MIEFLWKYMLLLLPAPFIIRWLLFRKDKKVNPYTLKIPFFKELKDVKLYQPVLARAGSLQFLLLSLAWVLLVLASARPIKIADSWSIDVEGRDLMIAIDTSGSMARPETLDSVLGTRLDTVKSVTRELINKRKGDRVGLIVFGTKAFLYTPLSFDLSLVKTFLDEAFVGMVGYSTAIGDALALSVKYLKDRPTKNKVLILLTDGVIQGGRYNISQALEFLKDSKIKVYAIGIGFSNAEGLEPILDENIDLDEPSLIRIAQQTSGEYFRVNSVSDLQKVFKYIENLEKIDENILKNSIDEIYYVFLVWMIIVLAVMLLLHLYGIYKARKEEELRLKSWKTLCFTLFVLIIYYYSCL